MADERGLAGAADGRDADGADGLAANPAVEAREFVVAAEELVVVRGLVEPPGAEAGRGLGLYGCGRRGGRGDDADAASGRDRVEEHLKRGVVAAAHGVEERAYVVVVFENVATLGDGVGVGERAVGLGRQAEDGDVSRQRVRVVEVAQGTRRP